MRFNVCVGCCLLGRYIDVSCWRREDDVVLGTQRGAGIHENLPRQKRKNSLQVDQGRSLFRFIAPLSIPLAFCSSIMQTQDPNLNVNVSWCLEAILGFLFASFSLLNSHFSGVSSHQPNPVWTSKDRQSICSYFSVCANLTYCALKNTLFRVDHLFGRFYGNKWISSQPHDVWGRTKKKEPELLIQNQSVNELYFHSKLMILPLSDLCWDICSANVICCRIYINSQSYLSHSTPFLSALVFFRNSISNNNNNNYPFFITALMPLYEVLRVSEWV